MNLNYAEIDVLLEELDLPGYRIQKIKQTDFSTIVLELYKPGKSRTLVLHLQQGNSAVFFTNTKYTSNLKLQRFAQLLRSRIMGYCIQSAEQIFSQRIVKFKLGSDDFTLLYLILWGSNTNAILCDQNHQIIDCMYRRPKKQLISGAMFNPEQDFLKKKPTTQYVVRDFPGKSFLEFVKQGIEEKAIHTDKQKYFAEAQRIYNAIHSSISGSIAKITKQITAYSEFEQFKLYGDLLNSQPPATNALKDFITIHDFDGINEVTIKIDPGKSLQENAALYYKLYKKHKNGFSRLQDDKIIYEMRLKKIEKDYSSLPAEDTEALQKFIIDYKPAEQKPDVNTNCGLTVESAGFQITVGRNKRESDQLLRDYAKGNDFWLHVRDFPGSHVFIKNRNKHSPPLDVLLDAANLALLYSKARNNGSADVFYTQVKYLRRAKHGVMGTVIPTQEKNIHVTADTQRIQKLIGNRK